MQNKNFEYKIGGRLRDFIPLLIMIAIFLGVSYFIYSLGNGAYIFTGFITALLLLLLIYAAYRFLFIKILVGKYEFYHQTSPFSGNCYEYSQIEEAWESSSKTGSGQTSYSFSYRTTDGKVTKFPFSSFASDMVDDLINRINKNKKEKKQKKQYIINGKTGGLVPLVFCIIISVAFTALTVAMLGELFMAIPTGIMALTSIYALTKQIFYHFCFTVNIEDTGFYLKTTPFDGKYYEYSDIVSCKEELKRNGRSDSPYFYFLKFTKRDGKVTKFLFDKSAHQREINELQKRIQNK